METANYVFFLGHKSNRIGVEMFSQWYPCTFEESYIDGTVITYTSAEQYMMANKALLFGDSDLFAEIMKTNDPAEIKKFGRRIKNFNQNEWDAHKFDIVTNGNRLKFGQNPAFMKRLIATGNKTIVEAADYDPVWGIGLKAEDAVNIPEKDWRGQNLLGKALMMVRDDLLVS